MMKYFYVLVAAPAMFLGMLTRLCVSSSGHRQRSRRRGYGPILVPLHLAFRWLLNECYDVETDYDDRLSFAGTAMFWKVLLITSYILGLVGAYFVTGTAFAELFSPSANLRPLVRRQGPIGEKIKANERARGDPAQAWAE